MTDQEILKEYREIIEKNITRLFKELNIENDIIKQNFANGYREGFVEGFVEGFKEGAREIAKRMIRMEQPLEKICKITQLSMEIVKELAAEVAANGRKEA